VGVAIATATSTWMPPLDWPNIAIAALAVLGLIALFGLFRMKRWGLWSYTVLAVLNVAISIYDQTFTWYSTILAAMLIVGGFAYYEQMS
jgi:uncharacterized membrane protein (DUF2068 family)